MAHKAQQAFCEQVKQWQPRFFHGQRVLEIGSRNINGSLRTLFSACEYVGLDCTPGPDVDVVCLAHEYQGEPGSFDVVVSGETLEHDPYAHQTVPKMRQVLRPGGLCLVTCASEGRAEHGTARQGRRYGPEPGFYRNVTLGQLTDWLAIREGAFQELFLRHHREAGDLYFYGIKA
jgi:SAM-dependent methyltransferase